MLGEERQSVNSEDTACIGSNINLAIIDVHRPLGENRRIGNGRKKDSAGMIDMAEILYNQHQGKSKIYLTWDAASCVNAVDTVNTVCLFRAVA